jgi:hypothetical protein
MTSASAQLAVTYAALFTDYIAAETITDDRN